MYLLGSHRSDNFLFFFCMIFTITEIISPIIAITRSIVRGTMATVQDCSLSLLLLTAAMNHYYALVTYHMTLWLYVQIICLCVTMCEISICAYVYKLIKLAML